MMQSEEDFAAGPFEPTLWFQHATTTASSQIHDPAEGFGLLAAYRNSKPEEVELKPTEKEAELSGVNTKDNSKRTPLHWASWKGHAEVVQSLLEAGAEVDPRDYNKCTPLSWAARHGHEDVVQQLLKAGAMLDAVDEAKRTPLHWAAEKGHLAVVRVLLLNGASKDQHDMFVRTPLHGAAQHGHTDVVELLLETGVDIKIGAKEAPPYTPTSFFSSPFNLLGSFSLFSAEEEADPYSRVQDDRCDDVSNIAITMDPFTATSNL